MLRPTLLLILLVATATQGVPHKRGPRFPVGRIVNGVAAQQGEFPGVLSLQDVGTPVCGAAILNEYWALTTAFCATGNVLHFTSLYGGSVDLDNGGTYHEVVEVISQNPYDSDIALLKVATPFNIDGVNVKAVTLPEQGQNPPDGANATVLGWGLNEDEEDQTVLRKTDNNIFNTEKCTEIYAGLYLEVFPNNICVAAPEGGHGLCYRDHGGPVFVNGTVVGLFSLSKGCSVPGYPAILTNVAYYRDWIREKIGV